MNLNNFNKIGLSFRAMEHILNELIDRYPHSVIKNILNKDKEILLFFAKTILISIKKLNKNDFNIRENALDNIWISDLRMEN